MLIGVSKTLQDFLTGAIADTRTDWVVLEALSGDPNAQPAENSLVLFLYAVEENPHLRNGPPVQTIDGYVRRPAALTLHYLIAYTGKTQKDVQERLALVIQAFHSHPRLDASRLDPSLLEQVDSLAVRMRDVPFDEANKIWTALNVPMRLALFYDVDAALIEPVDQTATGPVRTRRAGHGDLVPS